MISEQDLIQKAQSVLNPWKMTPYAEAGTVGCALVSDKGNIYTGVCIHAVCGVGFCAEHSAIASMITHGENKIEMIVAVDSEGDILPPCGRCREFMAVVNTGNAGTKVILPGKISALRDLLPDHWVLG